MSMQSLLLVATPISVSAHSCDYPDFVAIDYSLNNNQNELHRYSYNPTTGDYGTLQDTVFDAAAGYVGVHGFEVHNGIAYVSQWTGSANELTGYVVDPTLPGYGTSSVIAPVHGTPAIDRQNDVMYVLEGTTAISRVDLATGAVSSFITGGAQDGQFSQFGIEFGPDGRLYVLNQNDALEVYDAQTGAFIEYFATGTGVGRYGSRDIGFDASGNAYVSGDDMVQRFHGPGTAQAGTLIDTMTTGDWEHGFSFHPTTGEIFIAQYAYDDDLEVYNYAAGAQSPLYELPLDGGKDIQFIECSGPIVNQTPVVYAGTDLLVEEATGPYQLEGVSVTDDNFTGNPLTTNWAVVSSPAGSVVSISDASIINPSVTADVIGDYVLELTAADGEFTVSDTVTITVTVPQPNQAPTVSVEGPVEGAQFYTGSDVVLTVNAADSDGTIAQVELFVDGVAQGVVTQAPYTLSLSNVQNGIYAVSAVATDDEGAATTSAAVSFSVVDQPPAPVGLDFYSDATGDIEDTAVVYASGAAGEVAADPFEGITHYELATTYHKYQYIEFFTDASVDTTGYETLTLAVKGQTPNGRSGNNTVTLALTSGSYGGPTATQSFSLTDEYQNIELTLADFAGVDLTDIRGLRLNLGTMEYTDLLIDSIRFVNLNVENSAPTVSAGADQSIVEATGPFQIQGAAVTDDSFPGNDVITEWSVVSSPVGSSVTISDPAAVNPSVSANLVGDYVLQLTADDGEFSVADTVTLTVTAAPPNQTPTAAISQPTSGQQYTEGDTAAIAVSATDIDGTVAQVEVFVDGVSQAVLTNAPYALPLTDLQVGTYVISAVATDDDGDVSTPASATISVIPTPPNQAPTVSVAQPVDGTDFFVGSDVAVSVDATDIDGTVAQVEVFVDGVSQATLTQAPYIWTMTNAQIGAYAITAVATDNEGAVGASASATINVIPTPPNVAPTVTVTGPVDGVEFEETDDVAVTIDATDIDGTVAQVEVFVDGVSQATLTQAPYIWTMTNAQIGAYAITAVATDNEGATATSTVVTITVVEQPPAPVGLDIYSDTTTSLDATGVVYYPGLLTESTVDAYEGTGHYDFASSYYKYQYVEYYADTTVDSTGYDTLSFAMKGVNPNGRNTSNEVTITLTSGSYGGPSASYTFTVTDEYQNFEIPLSEFAGIDLTQVYGIKYTFAPMSFNNVYFDSIRFVNP